jgi:invasion protein IalB
MLHTGALHKQAAPRLAAAVALALAMAPLAAKAPALAAPQTPTPKAAGTFGDWTAYHYRTKKGPVCYIVSQPKKSEAFRGGKKLARVNRDPVYFLVTNRPADKVRGEVNTIIGYRFKPNSTVKLEIDGSVFTLFTVDDGAWSEGPAVDRRIVAAMKKGRTMRVHGTSARGTRTVDTYSLKGVTAALKRIDELCRK